MNRKVFSALLCAVALAFVPALADDDMEPGFFFGIEATSLQPSGGPQDYTLVDPDDTNGAPEGTIRSLEWDNEIAPRVFVGWLDDHGGMLTLTWWDYDEDASDSVTAASPMEVWDVLVSADNAFDGFAGTATAFGNVQANLIDLEYTRPLTVGDKFMTHWTGGFRMAELENSLLAAYDNAGSVNTVILGSEVEGFGITGGLSAYYKLSDRWGVAGGSSYSLLAGESETLNNEFNGATIYSNITGEKDTTFSILEANLSVTWHGPEWLYVWLGWEYAQWNNASDINLFPDDIAEGFLQNSVSDVSFSGVTLGAGFKF